LRPGFRALGEEAFGLLERLKQLLDAGQQAGIRMMGVKYASAARAPGLPR
jgi:hypothetical protein